MRQWTLKMILGAMVTAMAMPVLADMSQQTKDKINKAGEPVQRGASRAVNALTGFTADQQNEINQEIQSTINDADKLVAKLNSSGTKDNREKATELQKENQELKDKFAALKNAQPENYSNAYEETADAMNDVQEDYFEAGAQYQDIRRSEETRIGQHLSQLTQNLTNLQTTTQASPADVKEEVKETVNDVQKNSQEASQKLQQLKSATGNQWVDIRKDIDKLMDKSMDAIRETTAKTKAS